MKFFRLAASAGKLLFTDGPQPLARALRRHVELNWRRAIVRPSASFRLRPSFLPAKWRSVTRDLRQAMEYFGAEEIRGLRQRGERLRFPQAEPPLVSIILPHHNKAGYTLYCLRSILANTSGVPYEVIAIDDGSTDVAAHLPDILENVQCLRQEQNEGFIAACNRGAAAARGKYLCFLNNDTIVTPGWLEHLTGTFASVPGCGAVGARLIYPEGRLQEAGTILWRDGSSLGYGRNDDPGRPEYGYVRDVAYCSGACLLLPRSLFEQVGGFDGRYRPSYYEDADLCLRVSEAGYRVVYQPQAVIYHMEFGSSSPAKATQQMVTNRRVFADRWGAQLAARQPYAPANILHARDEGRGRRLLVIDDRIPTPPLGSGYPRSFAMVRMLARLGYRVTFFPLQEPEPFQPWLEQLQQLGVEVFHRPYDRFRRLLAFRATYFDALIISRPHNAAQAMHMIRRACPTLPIVYDAEALFSARKILAAHLKGRDLKPKRIRSLIASELSPLVDADAVITVSEVEQRTFREHLGDRRAFVWGHPLEPAPQPPGFAGRRDLLFVGGFAGVNTPNESELLFFIRDVLPLVRQKIDCRLVVVGANPPETIRAVAGEAVELVGFVEDLRGAYAGRRVFIAPHRVAAGIPLKVLEAMNAGIPCVVSDLLARQIGITDGNEALVGRTAAELAAKVIEAYEQPATWERLQHGALALIRRQCDPATMAARLEEAIDAATERRRSLLARHSSLHQP